MKAMLEINMPDNCSECPCCHFALLQNIHACKILNKHIEKANENKLIDCPLKPVE